MSFICIEENSSKDEIVGLTEMFKTRYEFLNNVSDIASFYDSGVMYHVYLSLSVFYNLFAI